MILMPRKIQIGILDLFLIFEFRLLNLIIFLWGAVKLVVNIFLRMVWNITIWKITISRTKKERIRIGSWTLFSKYQEITHLCFPTKLHNRLPNQHEDSQVHTHSHPLVKIKSHKIVFSKWWNNLEMITLNLPDRSIFDIDSIPSKRWKIY